MISKFIISKKRKGKNDNILNKNIHNNWYNTDNLADFCQRITDIEKLFGNKNINNWNNSHNFILDNNNRLINDFNNYNIIQIIFFDIIII